MKGRHFRAASRALAKGAYDDLVAAMSKDFADSTELASVPDWAAFVLQADAPAPLIDARTKPFIDSFIKLTTEGAHVDQPSRLTIGRRLDMLGDSTSKDWSPIQYLNYLLLGQVKPRRRAAVVGTMRDDGIYAIEWIAHYLALGFEHLFIYTNDNADGSEVLLRRLAAHGIITLIESRTAGTVHPEVKAFEHAVHLLHELRDFEWALFVDSDEFLMPSPAHGTVTGLLDAVDARSEKRPSAVLFEWMWYVSGMAYARRPGMMIERFQHAHVHYLTKTFVRVGDIVSMRRQHYPELKPGCLIVNSAFRPFDLRRIWNRRRPPCYDGGWVAHFWPKSFEEFSLKKARGESLNLAFNEYRRAFDLFFAWNGAETTENHRPPDSALVALTHKIAAALRALSGVAAAEDAVDRRFADLIARYDTDGGLRAIYERSRPDEAKMV